MYISHPRAGESEEDGRDLGSTYGQFSPHPLGIEFNRKKWAVEDGLMLVAEFRPYNRLATNEVKNEVCARNMKEE